MMHRKHILSLFLLITILIHCFPIISAASGESQKNSAGEKLSESDITACLVSGKHALDAGEYDKAIAMLSVACEKFPLLGDYALLWRAKAYEGKGDTDKSLDDLRIIKEKYRESPLIKKVRLNEIELLRKKKDSGVGRLFEAFIKDNPSNLDVKYSYAAHLKENNEKQKAKELFREIYISPSHLSASAFNELSPSDISAGDLIRRGKNLNSVWLFEESEKCFREALRRDKNQPDEAVEGLAYSLFRQKRYKEAAELYKTTRNNYWRARSILRSGDTDTFQSEMSEFSKTADKRIASVLIAYGTRKRRDGNIEDALKIFNSTLSQYPPAKEEALWATGWTYYL
ncbi:MAG: tetratricopeptide repeat protein, partial [Nitrospirae bacterium]|nr:tetratricopeptide repeat protein [Nitrospirota bacterium]